MFNVGDKVRLKAADINKGTYARKELEFGKVYTVATIDSDPYSPLVGLEEHGGYADFAEERFELATVPEVNVGDRIRVTSSRRGVERTVAGVVGADYAGQYYTAQGDYLGGKDAAERPEEYYYSTYTIEVIEKAKPKPKLPTELGTVLRHKDRNVWAVVRVDNDGTPWLGSVESSDDHWFTDAEVQELLDTGDWEVQ